jgi:hypothetical protein
MNLTAIFDKVKGTVTTMPEGTMKAMYDLVVQGGGTQRILRLEGGVFYEKSGDGYRQVDDIFSYIVGGIKGAPLAVVKMAEKAMRAESVNMNKALSAFCEGGKTALIVLNPKTSQTDPCCQVIVKDGDEVARFSNDEAFAFFKKISA